MQCVGSASALEQDVHIFTANMEKQTHDVSVSTSLQQDYKCGCDIKGRLTRLLLTRGTLAH